MKYLIENITYKNGNTRTDDKYAMRIGSKAELLTEPKVGSSLFFHYKKYDEDGRLKTFNITRTSIIEDVKYKSGYVIVYTQNSIYTFKEVEE